MLSTQLISPSVRYTLHGVSPPTSPDRTLEGHNKSDRVRPGDLEPESEALASMRADLQTATQQIAEGTAHLLATQQLVGGLRQGLDTNQQRMKEQSITFALKDAETRRALANTEADLLAAQQSYALVTEALLNHFLRRSSEAFLQALPRNYNEICRGQVQWGSIDNY